MKPSSAVKHDSSQSHPTYCHLLNPHIVEGIYDPVDRF